VGVYIYLTEASAILVGNSSHPCADLIRPVRVRKCLRVELMFDGSTDNMNGMFKRAQLDLLDESGKKVKR
jgi:hypothetical protein